MAEITYAQVRAGLRPAVIDNIKTEGDPVDDGKEVVVYKPAKGWVNMTIPPSPDIRPTGDAAKDLGAVGVDFTGINDTAAQVAEKVGISVAAAPFKNTYNGGPQLILNAGRVIMNASTDFAMVFGAKGVIVSSGEESIHLDAYKEVVLHGVDGVFIGLPGGDNLQPSKNKKNPANKGNATIDIEYEPLVLGLKLANWLDDLIQVLQQATMVGFANAYFREDTQENFRAIRARIPEMVSTYAFVDGISHEAPNPFFPTPGLQITLPPQILSGEFIAGTDEADKTLQQPSKKDAKGPGAPLQLPGFFEDIDDADDEKLD